MQWKRSHLHTPHAAASDATRETAAAAVFAKGTAAQCLSLPLSPLPLLLPTQSNVASIELARRVPQRVGAMHQTAVAWVPLTTTAAATLRGAGLVPTAALLARRPAAAAAVSALTLAQDLIMMEVCAQEGAQHAGDCCCGHAMLACLVQHTSSCPRATAHL